METKMTEKELQKVFGKNETKAIELLNNEDEMEQYLVKVEEKLRSIQGIGPVLGDVPVLISLVRAYMKKEYTNIPFATLIAIVCALIYVLSPIDLIPDIVAGVGYADDVAIVALALKIAKIDLDLYKEWKEENKQKKEIIVEVVE